MLFAVNCAYRHGEGFLNFFLTTGPTFVACFSAPVVGGVDGDGVAHIYMLPYILVDQPGVFHNADLEVRGHELFLLVMSDSMRCVSY